MLLASVIMLRSLWVFLGGQLFGIMVALRNQLGLGEGSVIYLLIKEKFMQTLHVRSVPDELYNRLRVLAQSEQRSLSAQVIQMLDRALAEEAKHQEQAQILADIKRRRFAPPAAAPDSIEMLREDRNR